jgi:flagellar hook-associated protein 1
MSISSALSSALSGLTANSRMAEVAASNVSNALTEGYARREVSLSSRVIGMTGVGVTINGVTRHVNRGLLQDLRLSNASLGSRDTTKDFLLQFEKTLGTPDQASSLSGRIAALEKSLIEAAARPESEARLAAVIDAARWLTQGMTDTSDKIQQARQSADASIATQVERVNSALRGVADINKKIRVSTVAGQDTTALMDQRQQLIDQISGIVPLREVARDNGQVALYTTGGSVLLDGRPSVLGFTATGFITPDMTLASAALSGLTVNGQAISTSPAGGRLGEGSLSALFDLRDRIAPESQIQIDAIARDLIERFETPGLDPTAVPGAAGLFTDDGAPFDALSETGLAGRLRLTDLVQPESGGALWRLRDGLGAASAGAPGYSGQLTAWSGALTAARAPASGGFTAGARTFADLASELVSSVTVRRLSSETEASFATARADGLRTELLRDGVDTDDEIQRLLQIEQAYAANARVIQTVDDMIQTILGI